MSIELSKQAKADAISSMQRYFDENLSEPIGDLPSEMLLNFFLKEIGPVIYNQAIADAQGWLQGRVLDLEGSLYEEPFQYWKQSRAKRNR